MTVTAITPSMAQFLRWVAASERTYEDAMEAWQTSCPRFSVWEDATIAGYIVLRRTPSQTTVLLSDLGRDVLEASSAIR